MKRFFIGIFIFHFFYCLFLSSTYSREVPDSLLYKKYDYHMHYISGQDKEYSDSMRMDVFGELRYYNTEVLYKKYITYGFKGCIDDLFYYYHDIVHHLPSEQALQEVDKMKKAARQYKSKELACEAELMEGMYMPHNTREDVDRKVKKLQHVADQAGRRGDKCMQLRAMRIILEDYWSDPSGPRYAESFKQARHIVTLLENVSEKEYPLKRNDYYMLAEPYYLFRDYDRAAAYLEKALTDTTHTFFDRSNLQARNTLGIYYRYINELDKSDSYFLSILQSADMVKYRPMYDAIAIGNLGHNCILREQYDEAIRLFNVALPTSVSQKDYSFTSGITLGLGECYLAKGNLQKTKAMIDTTLAYMHQPDISYNLHRFPGLYTLLSKYYAAKGELKLSRQYIDSLSMANKMMDSKFNSLVILRGEQELFENQQAAKQAQLVRHRNVAVFSLSILILAIAALLTVSYFYRKKRAAYRVLVEKNLQWLKEPDVTVAKENGANNDSNESRQLMGKIRRLVVDEEGFKNAEISLASLSEHLQVNRSYLSRAINTITGKNFNQWLNEYRIKEAIALLSDSKHDHISIEAIGYQVGFNNRTSFYQAFKKITGLTPSDFRKNR